MTMTGKPFYIIEGNEKYEDSFYLWGEHSLKGAEAHIDALGSNLDNERSFCKNWSDKFYYLALFKLEAGEKTLIKEVRV